MQEWIFKYWLETLFGLLAAAGGFGFRHIVKREKAMHNAMLALLRDRIIGTYNHCLDRGACPIYALENLHALYREYKALGGNGAMDDIMAKVEKMPTAQPVPKAGDAAWIAG